MQPHNFTIYFQYLFIPLFIGLLTNLEAQDTLIENNASINQKIEALAEAQINELDYASLQEELSYFRQNPINLNYTTAQILSQLQLLNNTQINNLLQHISQNGKLITIYELQTIDGFDANTIQQLLPYVFVNDKLNKPHFTLHEMFKNGGHQLVFRVQQVLQQQQGFVKPSSNASPNSFYLGSPQKIYTRYRFNYGTNVSWGITAEKDPGEQLFRATQKQGFDFYSAHFYTRSIPFIKVLALGDYQLTFGQGLAAWTGFSFGKSIDVVCIKKIGSGIQPYTSVDENFFMRGIASVFQIKKIEITTFLSHKKIDANVSNTSIDSNEPLAISSLQNTGYHSTLSEIANKHSISQTVYGIHSAYKIRNFNMGLTAINTILGAPLQKETRALYNQFEFSGKSIANLSVDYDFLIKNFNFFGEAACSNNKGMAYLNGLLVALHPKFSISILQRSYQRNYQSFFSNGFSESTNTANENGLYSGFVAKPINNITVAAYYDAFTFHWLKYQVSAPSYGNDYVLQINYTPSKKLDMYVRIKQRDKFQNTTAANVMDKIVPTQQKNYRFHISYAISATVKLKNRVEYISIINANNKLENGYLIYQDIVYQGIKSPFSFSLRYALFETDSYDSRIYAYENDVLYAYSIPAYYYRGARMYGMINYAVNKKTEIWIRYGETFYNNKNTISSGLTEIMGATKSELKVQALYRF